MSLESQIADLVTATTALTKSVNDRMDQVVALANAVVLTGKKISGSTIDNTPVGQTTPAPVIATSLQSSGTTSLGATTAASIDNTPIGQTVAAALGGTVLTLDGATQLRRTFVTDGSSTTYGFIELVPGIVGMHAFSASDDGSTPNCCAYLITTIWASKVNTAVALKSEVQANDLRLVMNPTTGKLYLAVKKGNVNGPMLWQFQLYTTGKTPASAFPITWAASLTGYTTISTL